MEPVFVENTEFENQQRSSHFNCHDSSAGTELIVLNPNTFEIGEVEAFRNRPWWNKSSLQLWRKMSLNVEIHQY